MISDKFMVNSEPERMAQARYATENFAWKAKLDKRNTLRLTLLVEETLGMVKNLVDEFYGQMWFESNENACELHLQATADMNNDRKQELLSVSSSGRNAAAKGFMAKIGEVFSLAMHGFGRSVDLYGQEMLQYGVVHDGAAMAGMTPIWSLQTYRADLAQARDNNVGADEAWDELEKSIVAKLADDVVVGVKGDRIELVILKKF